MPSFPELRKPSHGIYINDPDARPTATQIATLAKLLPVALLAVYTHQDIPQLIEALLGTQSLCTCLQDLISLNKSIGSTAANLLAISM